MKVATEKFISRFFALESASGILLMFATLLAIVLANSPWQQWYQALIDTPIHVQIGTLLIAKPLLLWINDGLMAIFFFLVGLELKRECLVGELSDRNQIALPIVGAIGGMAVPALIYWGFNYHDATAMRGWAIPTATDIAFALGILSLLGSRVPTSLKLFLTSLAIFDDLGAIVIIAVFYTEKLSPLALGVAACCLPVLWILNRRGVESKGLYVALGLVLWAAMLKSGIHATLAGVILAMFVPMQSGSNPKVSPLQSMEEDLHAAVAFIVLPIFAFANAGLNLANIGITQLLHPVSLGITLGLLVGKQVGIFGVCVLAIKKRWIRLPSDMTLRHLYGASVLCGIGFTMSLFIGSLAFGTLPTLSFDERLGIIVGSTLSGIIGYLLLKRSLPAA